jgi:hypothetical protein
VLFLGKFFCIFVNYCATYGFEKIDIVFVGLFACL